MKNIIIAAALEQQYGEQQYGIWGTTCGYFSYGTSFKSCALTAQCIIICHNKVLIKTSHDKPTSDGYCQDILSAIDSL